MSQTNTTQTVNEIFTKEVSSGYVNISNEVATAQLEQAFPSSAQWVAKVTDYQTSKEYKRIYTDLDSDYDFSIENFNTNDLIEIKYQKKQSNKYSYVYRSFWVVTDITNDKLVYQKFDTIAKAIKFQKKIFK